MPGNKKAHFSGLWLAPLIHTVGLGCGVVWYAMDHTILHYGIRIICYGMAPNGCYAMVLYDMIWYTLAWYSMLCLDVWHGIFIIQGATTIAREAGLDAREAGLDAREALTSQVNGKVEENYF